MNKSSEKSTFADVKPEVSKSSLSLNDQKTQNSFIVFGNVQISSQNEDTIKKDVPKNTIRIEDLAWQLMGMESKVETLNNLVEKNSNYLSQILDQLEKNDKLKENQKNNDRKTVHFFGIDENTTNEFTFKMPTKIDGIKQQLAEKSENSKVFEDKTVKFPNRHPNSFTFHQ